MYDYFYRLFGSWVALDVYAVESDSFDRLVFSELMEQSSLLKELEARAVSFYPVIGPLLQDIFSALYKYNVKVKTEPEIRPGYLPNREIILALVQTPEYLELKHFTQLDELAAACGTLGFCRILVEELEAKAGELKGVKEEIQTSVQIVEKMEELKSLTELSRQASTFEAQNRLLIKAQETVQEIESASNRLEEQKQNNSIRDAKEQVLRPAAEEATRRTVSQVRDLSDFVAEWGTDKGAPQALPLARRLELAARLSTSPKMHKLARMVGRLKRFALSQEQKKLHRQVEEVYDIVHGQDLAQLIPYELMQLTHPVLRRDFKRRLAEGRLLQYHLEGRDPSGKGPLIVCVDGSYSMEGDKELWAKSVALAFFTLARRKKRAFVAIQFGSQKDDLFISQFPKSERRVDLKKFVEMAEHFIGGGTDFEKPLNAALRIMEEEKGYAEGDIIFITDGDCLVSQNFLQDFLRAKEEKGFRVYSVLVDMGRTTANTVSKFSDRISLVSELSDDEAKDVFRMVDQGRRKRTAGGAVS